jgi:hypothetical protein
MNRQEPRNSKRLCRITPKLLSALNRQIMETKAGQHHIRSGRMLRGIWTKNSQEEILRIAARSHMAEAQEILY